MPSTCPPQVARERQSWCRHLLSRGTVTQTESASKTESGGAGERARYYDGGNKPARMVYHDAITVRKPEIFSPTLRSVHDDEILFMASAVPNLGAF